MIDNSILFDLKKLGKLEIAKFVKRHNRFVGEIIIDGKRKSIHIADTGRLREILTEGREVLVVKNREELKTDYKLISAKMDNEWVLVNTSIHSRIGRKAIKKGVLGFVPESIKNEVQFGDSRLDYLVNGDTFIELKASNLLLNNRCLFPDAPTERGVKHLKELYKATKEGYKAVILIMGLRDCGCFYPNVDLDKKFSDEFFNVLNKGVKFIGFKIKINEKREIVLNGKMEICPSRF
jgi:sugar fermentation stimulation protein A